MAFPSSASFALVRAATFERAHNVLAARIAGGTLSPRQLEIYTELALRHRRVALSHRATASRILRETSAQ